MAAVPSPSHDSQTPIPDVPVPPLPKLAKMNIWFEKHPVAKYFVALICALLVAGSVFYYVNYYQPAACKGYNPNTVNHFSGYCPLIR